MGVAGHPVMPVLLVVALAVIAFCAPMVVVVLSRGNVRSVPRRATAPRSSSRTTRSTSEPQRPSRSARRTPPPDVVRVVRPPLPRREQRPSQRPSEQPSEMAGTVLHAVPDERAAERVVAALTQAGFATVMDPDNARLILVESPADADQHELVRTILTGRAA